MKRIQCKEDKRGHMLEPTAKGFALRKAMWAIYAPAMDEAMKRIDDREALKLAELAEQAGRDRARGLRRQGLSRPSNP